MSTRPLDNARAALQQLQAFLATPAVSDGDRAGVIQAFGFTFEATWKLFKAIGEADGLNAESPRRALTAAHRLGIVEDEATWLEMLQHRNLTSHVYHAALAIEIFVAIRDRYAAALAAAVERAASQVI